MGEWRRLHNEELNDLYCSPNIVRVIKSRRVRWAGHVARVGEERLVYRVLVGKPEGKICAVVSLEPGYMDWVREFVFLFNLFSLPSPPNCYCSSDCFLNPHSGRIV